MKLAAKGSVHHLLTCVGQVGFFTWGCVVTQPVMNLLHVALSQPPILFQCNHVQASCQDGPRTAHQQCKMTTEQSIIIYLY